MDWSALGDWGLAAMGIAAIGLPVQVAVGVAFGTRRNGPVFLAILVPVAVLVLGLLGTVAEYGRIGRMLVDPSDPAWAPLYVVVDRGVAAGAASAAAMAATGLCLPGAIGAAVGSLRAEHRGMTGPAIAALTGLVGGLVIAGLAVHRGLPWLMLPGLALALLGTCAGGSLAAVRARDLSGAGVGVASLAVGALALVTWGAARLDLTVPDLIPELAVPWAAILSLADHESMSRQTWLVLGFVAALSLGSTLPGLSALRVRSTGIGTGLDIAITGAILLGGAVAMVWAAVRRAALGKLAGAHAAWVLAAAPAYDVPRVEVLPPRVLVPSDNGSRWIELRDAGGVALYDAVGSYDEVGAGLRRGDGLVLPARMPAEELYLLLVDSRAGAVSLVGCGPVSSAHRAVLTTEPLYAVGRCGAFPLRLRVPGSMPDPVEVIVLKDRLVQFGYDVIELAELPDLAGRDVVLRLQADATIADLVAALGRLERAAAVYLGWGVTLEGDDIPVGVEPGLRVVEHLP
ncbi:MAG: hypothetical protein FJ090_04055 [Deltaproteobacteria bacterium]|nr:hypothetical protein [Deltaproteobacteria bacterium]